MVPRRTVFIALAHHANQNKKHDSNLSMPTQSCVAVDVLATYAEIHSVKGPPYWRPFSFAGELSHAP
jgi:hypothetical protein